MIGADHAWSPQDTPTPPPDATTPRDTAADAWTEYLEAARTLDRLHDAAALEAAAATRLASTARAELADVTGRLRRQATRLADEAARAGVAPPELRPTDAELRKAGRIAGGPAGAPEALYECRRWIETAEAALDRPAHRRWPGPVSGRRAGSR